MIATINAILWTGAKPVIVDVDDNLCLSLEKLKTIKNLHTVILFHLMEEKAMVRKLKVGVGQKKYI